LYNVGELYIRQGEFEKANSYLNQSMSIAIVEGNTRAMAFNYWSFGAIESGRKHYDEALAFYFKAEEVWKNEHDLRSLVQTYQEIAEIYRLQHKYDEAEKYLNEAMRFSSQIKVADLQVNNFLRIARLDSARGNYGRALYYLSRHNSLKDSVYNLLKVEQIARIQAIYQTEARDRENKQLRAEKELHESELYWQKLVSIAISICLIIAGAFAWMLNRQRRKIQEQKESIEIQAKALTKLNDDLQELNKTLEARIAERTTQLTVQNQRLTEYTFVNAHKLRAPVASILGLVNLIPKVSIDERDALITHLKTCGDQLDATIRELSRSLESAIVTEEK
jgi:C4-dicarboxylate-specific signal transduction histidine kinase